ncbi:hypothetical protein SNE40_017616 [Patella caerulea]|uniref:Uncharacterized protein n=1 Tax=Patella caerulea TaxID=87958 RepID=A0AAN8JE67_PATCE
MCTLWMISIAFVLASMLPRCRSNASNQCNVTECKQKGRNGCILLRCFTEYDDCGGKKCNLTAKEVCLDNECVSKDENCWNKKGVSCRRRGLPCGDGQFCPITSKCINDTCFDVDTACVGGGDGTRCGPSSSGSYTGLCSGGICIDPCGKRWRCPCMKDGDKYCTRKYYQLLLF